MSKARDLADLAKNANDRLDTVATSDGALSNRNMVINGGLTVWQRGTASVTVGNGVFLADRFKLWESTDGTVTAEQSTEAPDGFATSLKLQVTSADTSLGSNQYMQFGHNIEGQDLQRLGYGTAAANTITLSFYVRSSKTGTYGISAFKADATAYQLVKEYTINAADTWERKTITIEPDANIKASGGAIGSDNQLGISLYWNLAMGSAYTGGTDNTWSSDTSDYSTTNVNNWMDSTSNNFYITGVQLEVGDTATPFEHRSYGDELAKCQRYYEKSYNQGVYAGAVNDVSGSIAYIQYLVNSTYNATHVSFATPKRAAPSVSMYAYDGTANKTYVSGSNYDADNQAGYASIGGFMGGVSNTYSGGTGVKQVIFHYTADAEL